MDLDTRINKIFKNIYMFNKDLKQIKYIKKKHNNNDDPEIIKGNISFVDVDTNVFISNMNEISNLNEKLKYDKYYVRFGPNNYLSHNFIVLIENLNNKTIKDLLIEIKNEWYKLNEMLNPIYKTHDKDENNALSNYSMEEFSIIGYINKYPVIKFETNS